MSDVTCLGCGAINAEGATTCHICHALLLPDEAARLDLPGPGTQAGPPRRPLGRAPALGIAVAVALIVRTLIVFTPAAFWAPLLVATAVAVMFWYERTHLAPGARRPRRRR